MTRSVTVPEILTTMNLGDSEYFTDDCGGIEVDVAGNEIILAFYEWYTELM